MEVLPKNWVKIESNLVSDITDYVANGSFKTLSDNVRTFDSENFAILIRLKDFNTNFSKDLKYIDESSYLFLNKSRIEPGDLFISNVGNPGICYIVPELNKPMSLGPNGIRLRSKNKINVKFIKYYLESPHGKSEINNIVTGTAQLKFNKTDFRNLKFPLPPLPEQERIVAKLDALFAQHEAMKKALERIPQLLKDFRQQVLMQAITGELTKKWRNGKKLSKNKIYLDEKVKILQDSLLPIKSPESWNLIHLGYILEDLTDYHANGSYEILKENVTLLENKSYAAMIRSTNFEKNNFDDLLIYINETAYNFLSKSKLYGGEILISKIGNAGSVYFMPQLNIPSSLAMNLFMLRINRKYNNKYIYYHLISKFSKENINKYVRGVTTKSIDKVSVRSLTINLPSFEEQQEIVHIIESLFHKADIIEKRYKNLKEKLDSLPQAILHKAFKGELVPQLPTDGDAKDLLEEILKLKKEVKKK